MYIEHTFESISSGRGKLDIAPDDPDYSSHCSSSDQDADELAEMSREAEHSNINSNAAVVVLVGGRVSSTPPAGGDDLVRRVKIVAVEAKKDVGGGKEEPPPLPGAVAK